MGQIVDKCPRLRVTPLRATPLRWFGAAGMEENHEMKAAGGSHSIRKRKTDRNSIRWTFNNHMYGQLFEKQGPDKMGQYNRKLFRRRDYFWSRIADALNSSGRNDDRKNMMAAWIFMFPKRVTHGTFVVNQNSESTKSALQPRPS